MTNYQWVMCPSSLRDVNGRSRTAAQGPPQAAVRPSAWRIRKCTRTDSVSVANGATTGRTAFPAVGRLVGGGESFRALVTDELPEGSRASGALGPGARRPEEG